MKIKLSKSNTNTNTKTCKFSSELEWAKLLYKEGIKANQRLTADVTVDTITYKTLSFDKILVELNLRVITKPKQQQHSQHPINISWKKILQTIPKQDIAIVTRKIIDRPNYLSNIYKLKQITIPLTKVTARTITNRIATKGKIFLDIEYYPG